MKINTIYKATNKINGFSYIGHDKKWPKRKKDHFIEATKNPSKKQYWFNFHKAIREFGWENFEWDILYQTLEDINYSLKIMEKYFITKYDSYNNGYNMTLGGEGFTGKHKKETLELLSQQNKGKNNPTFGKYGKNHPAYGYKHTQDHLTYMSSLMMGNEYGLLCPKGYENILSKNYVFYNGATKYEFKGLRNFCREQNLDQGAMTRVNSGKQLSHKGFTKHACTN